MKYFKTKDEFQEKPEIAIEKSKEELKITKIKAQ